MKGSWVFCCSSSISFNLRSHLNYVDASEICEAKTHWIKANQLLLLKSENYKNLTLKLDEKNIIRCYSRLENGNKNNHPTTQ